MPRIIRIERSPRWRLLCLTLGVDNLVRRWPTWAAIVVVALLALLLGWKLDAPPAIAWVLRPGDPGLVKPVIRQNADILALSDEDGACRVQVNVAAEDVDTNINEMAFFPDPPADVGERPYPVLFLENASKHDVFLRAELFTTVDGVRKPLTTTAAHEQPLIRLPAGSAARWCAPEQYPYRPQPGEPVSEIVLIFHGPEGRSEVRVLGIGFKSEPAPLLVVPRDHPEILDEDISIAVERRMRLARSAADSLENSCPRESAPLTAQPSVEGAPTTWDDLPESQQALLLDLEARGVRWFVHHARRHPAGLAPDRAPPRSTAPYAARHRTVSVAGLGFHIACLIAAERRGLVEPGTAAEEAEVIFDFLLQRVERRKGLFPHFIRPDDWVDTGESDETEETEAGETHGKRKPFESEYSTIDHALLLAAAYCMRQWAPDSRAADLVPELARVAWDALMIQRDGGRLLSMGVEPSSDRLLPAAWDAFNEGLLAYVLAAAAEPEIGRAFQELARRRFAAPENDRYFPGISLPLFVHQYPQLYLGPGIDLPGGLDLYANSRRATLYNRAFCLGEPERTYRAGFWGVTAGDTPSRDPQRRAYRAFQPVPGGTHGISCPAAVLASAPFALGTVAADLSAWSRLEDGRVWSEVLGDLGFVDTFRIDEQGDVVCGEDAIAITVGAGVLGVCEARDHGISRLFLADPDVRRGLQACGMRFPATRDR